MSLNTERLRIIKGTPYLITCDVLCKDFHWLVDRVEELEEELSFEKMTRVGMDSIERYTGDIKKENKRFRDALMIAYSHCEDNLMDETIDVIRMALDGEEVKEIWSGDLEKGYSLLKEQEQ